MKKTLIHRLNEEVSNLDKNVIDAEKQYSRIAEIDSELLVRLGKGDHAAFNAVYLAYADPIIRFLNSILRNQQDAEEITQEVFANLWTQKETINSQTKIKNYLYTAARNRAFNLLRNKKVQFRYIEETMAVSEDKIDISGEELLESKEVRLLIEMTILNMPKQRRTVFEFSRKDGMSHEQIAKTLGISTGTVGQHIKLALKSIREVLALYIVLFCNWQ